MSRFRSVGFLLAVAVIAAACSGGSGTSSSSAGGPPGSTGAPRTKGADPGDESAGSPQSAAYTPTGPLIADSGFRPETNGLPFENYGSTLPSGSAVTNMTPEDVRKMFGDGVCADASTGKCDLIPEAQSWMDQANAATSGGHCEGFSITSLLLWAGKLQADPFGAPSVPALTIDGNTALQRQIAYDFLFQGLPSVLNAEVNGTPNDILNVLKDALKPNPSEAYTVGIYKADHTGGHAVTPYAIEDKGNGIENLLIYDNNWPGVTREITFDTNANKWSYDAATNPNEPSEQYIGDASTGTMELDPTFPGLGPQPCPFCNKEPGQAGASAAPAPRSPRARTGAPTGAPTGPGAGGAPAGAVLASLRKDAPNPDTMDEIWLEGSDTDHGHLLITDAAGHQLGFLKGALVNQIPGAHVEIPKSDRDWSTTLEPTYYVPDGAQYSITLDGSTLESADNTSIGVIGPSFETQVDDIGLNPGDKDTFVVSPDATEMTYSASRPEAPTISVGVSDDTADYTFEVSGVSDQPGDAVHLRLPAESSSLTIDTGATGGTSTVNLQMTREDDQGKSVFKHEGIALGSGDQATLQFGNWTNGQSLPLQITHGGSQTTETLTDQGG